MELKELLGIELYKKLFPAILTDRGTEFCAPEMIEVDTSTGEVLTHVFSAILIHRSKKELLKKTMN